MSKQPSEYIELSELEVKFLKKLSSCTFLPGSYEKRFVRSVSSVDPKMTQKQRDYFHKVAYRYRKQMGYSDDEMAGAVNMMKGLSL